MEFCYSIQIGSEYTIISQVFLQKIIFEELTSQALTNTPNFTQS